MAGLFEILEKIKAKPGMYLGSPSVSNLFMFLVGYKTARRELGIEPTNKEVEFYQEFQPWLQKRMQMITSNSWAAMIQLQCGNEKEAFEWFFQLLNEFWQRDKEAETIVGERKVSHAA